MAGIEEFKKELGELLNKYPDLPAFTLKIQPRIAIEISSQQISLPSYPPLTALNSNPPIIVPVSEDKPDITLLEKGISAQKLAEMKSQVEIIK